MTTIWRAEVIELSEKSGIDRIQRPINHNLFNLQRYGGPLNLPETIYPQTFNKIDDIVNKILESQDTVVKFWIHKNNHKENQDGMITSCHLVY